MRFHIGDIVELTGGADAGQIGRVCAATQLAYTVRIWKNPLNHAKGSIPTIVSPSQLKAASGDAPAC
ncbi:hypothetical protein [Maricaulis salignorans]|uniref:KOW domain-containing protein n=1 Tax=Maricaulis salignorans TaxID=144026 RepID=A0A1G9VXB1_9PROT|nr:hypothetical protein [Maricaulis salignorans]SDM76591.1 hypothetical protein SAMN04488568_12129 [Maricaulis salignorans]